MSTENHAIVHELVDAWNRSDIDGVLALFDCPCEVVFRPDSPRTWPASNGHAELRRWSEAFLAAWELSPLRTSLMIERHETMAIWLRFTSSVVGRAVASRLTRRTRTSSRSERAKIARWHNFNERAEALEAVGLRE